MLLVGSGTALSSDRFEDVPDDHPFHAEISSIADAGVTTGFPQDDGTFKFLPDLTITRQAVAAFVYRMANSPEGDFTEPFTDVEEGDPFYDAIAWASTNNIIAGFSDGEFKPTLDITRQAFAAFLYRLNGSPDGPFTEDFSDLEEGDPFYTEISWASENGIVNGYSDGEFKPSLTIKRQAVAAMIDRFLTGGFAILPVSNQSFAVSPSEAATNSVSATATDNTGRRSYSVSIPAGVTDVNIALVPAENVSVDSNGAVTFTSNAIVADNTGPSIEVVNGSTDATVAAGTGNEREQVNDVAPVNGTVTFAIDSDVADKVVPIVYEDSINDTTNVFELNDNQTPRESFGIGGQKNWVPAEANIGNQGTVTVTDVNRTDDYFTASGGTPNPATFYYDNNDTYQFQGVGITMSEFEGLLTNTDTVAVNYATAESGVSTFNVQSDNVPAVTKQKATVGGTGDDVTITWTASTQPDAVYDIYRDDDGTPGNTGDDALTVGTDTKLADNVSGTSFTANDEPNGTYGYFVVAQSPTTTATSTAAATADVTVPLSADTTPPDANYTAVFDNQGFPEATDGDRFVVVFNEAMTIVDGDQLRVRDAEGEFANLALGTEATYTLTQGGTWLTVTLVGDPTIDGDADATTANTGDIEWGATTTISAQVGITDAAGNNWDASASTDNTLNVDTAAPTITAAAGDESADTLTLTYDKPVACPDTSSSRAQFAYTDANDTAVNPTAVTCAGTTTVVLTFADGILVDADNGSLTYTQSSTESSRVEGANQRDATSPETEAVTVTA